MWVALGLGSNREARENLAACLDALLLRFRDMATSSVFRSRAAGEAGGADYLNMVVAFECELTLPELHAFTKDVERKLGRGRDAEGAVSIDIDILLYGELTGRHAGIELPRPQLLEAAWVLWPLAQVAGRRRHPLLKQTYKELWEHFAGDRSGITAVDFEWHGRRLSHAAPA